jgi:uncharacterized membrane protein
VHALHIVKLASRNIIAIAYIIEFEFFANTLAGAISNVRAIMSAPAHSVPSFSVNLSH